MRALKHQRRRPTAEVKLAIVRMAALLGVDGAAHASGFDASNIHRWIKKEAALKAQAKSKKSSHKGPKLEFPELEGKVLEYCKKMRSSGLRLSLTDIAIHAQQIQPEMAGWKLARAIGWAKRFAGRNSLVSRAKTKSSQKEPTQLDAMAKSFTDFLQQQFQDFTYGADFVLNMDQTPVYLDAVPSYTLDFEGTKEVCFVFDTYLYLLWIE